MNGSFFFTALCVNSSIVCLDAACTVCISKHGNVYAFGRPCYLQRNEIYPRSVLGVSVISLHNISSIAGRGNHVICLDRDGNVFTFGSNAYGQLGIGKSKSKVPFSCVPVKIDVPLIQKVSCGIDFSVCLSCSGYVYSFGSDSLGQLGHGKLQRVKYPKKIKSLKDVDFVTCGDSYVICRTLSDDIYAWGDNRFGQLGIDTSIQYKIPFKCTSWPKEVIDIKCTLHTLVLTSKQEVFSCGYNDFGQLGRKSEEMNFYVKYSSNLIKIEELCEIKRIECSSDSSMCIDNYNNLYVFGGNGCGQLGLGHTNHVEIPLKHPSLSNIIDISSGGRHTFVKTSDNEIYAFGSNELEQLSSETENKRQLSPISIFQGKEDVWYSKNIEKLKLKSARK